MPRAVRFSTQRLARRWDSSIFTVRRLIKSGDVPAVRIGGRFYVHTDTVEIIKKAALAPAGLGAEQTFMASPLTVKD